MLTVAPWLPLPNNAMLSLAVSIGQPYFCLFALAENLQQRAIFGINCCSRHFFDVTLNFSKKYDFLEGTLVKAGKHTNGKYYDRTHNYRRKPLNFCAFVAR